MFASIVALVLAALWLLIGYGDRLSQELMWGKLKLLTAIVVIMVAVILPPSVGEDFTIDYGGVAMVLAAIVVIITRVAAKDYWKNMLGIIFVGGVALLYRYFIPEVVDGVAYGILYTISLTLAAYITSKKAYDIIINATIGIAAAQGVMYLIPAYGAELVLGGKGEVIILVVIAALLLQQIVLSLASFHHLRKGKRL